ncbi:MULTISPECIES: oxidoreductase [unclassified Staphylococcus]|uniref:oxidoreductase n=1 Tax=unclassified Staphylococcus TaxID=91994 RepID=UPI0021D3A6C9|nr:MULTISPECIES: oxidoreductase [unclassified Staphylococcus]UXR78272.1 oxidoreductase [Staphylococcus sp. IVB6227]UXR82436.1 oxidoreductase [Staphylococcus sp. IVB6214]
MLNIAVIGAGAVGTSIAMLLQPAMPVTLLGRQPDIRIYHDRETQMETTVNVHALDTHQAIFDVIFIAVKTHQLATVTPHLSRITHTNTRIILAQNGYGQLDSLTHYHAYQGVVYISGEKKGQHVTHFRDRRIHVQHDTCTEQLAQQLVHTKLELVLEDDIEHTIWYKLLVNLGINTVTALTQDTARILKHPDIYKLCRQLLLEGLSVAKACGVTFPETTVADIMQIYTGYPDEMGTSMYYDVKNKQPLEVEAIQGYIYRQSQLHKLHTPVLERAYHNLKQLDTITP